MLKYIIYKFERANSPISKKILTHTTYFLSDIRLFVSTISIVTKIKHVLLHNKRSITMEYQPKVSYILKSFVTKENLQSMDQNRYFCDSYK